MSGRPVQEPGRRTGGETWLFLPFSATTPLWQTDRWVLPHSYVCPSLHCCVVCSLLLWRKLRASPFLVCSCGGRRGSSGCGRLRRRVRAFADGFEQRGCGVAGSQWMQFGRGKELTQLAVCKGTRHVAIAFSYLLLLHICFVPFGYCDVLQHGLVWMQPEFFVWALFVWHCLCVGHVHPVLVADCSCNVGLVMRWLLLITGGTVARGAFAKRWRFVACTQEPTLIGCWST